jgi:flavodoxin I
MKTLVIFDSMYGNTEKIARAMAAALSGEVVIRRANEVIPGDLQKIDRLFIGSPTQGGRPLKSMQAFIDSLNETNLKGIKTAVFDTRIPAKWVTVFGFAAGKIAGALKKKGAVIITKEEGFLVKASKGPLLDGELERAAEWAKQLTQI